MSENIHHQTESNPLNKEAAITFFIFMVDIINSVSFFSSLRETVMQENTSGEFEVVDKMATVPGKVNQENYSLKLLLVLPSSVLYLHFYTFYIAPYVWYVP